ncbi:37 kDa salivary gland allergen Aed a 2-like isoform X2 [Armigeres subalbatus]|uniref:37 kDa salivary gland allergen Aed a 2-like isoform X2 n=1 Tax=Armigeres subalbatus TaxID=124917 RepID=UPI002ED40267
MASCRIVLVAMLQLCLTATVSLGWEALDPEQVLFGFSRCGEEFTPNDENREVRIKNWAKWTLEPLDNWTMCYVRCCLQRLELFNVDSGLFATERLTVQYQKYKQYNGVDVDEVQEFANALKNLPRLTDCKSVFTTLFVKLLKYVPIIVKLYHGSPTINKAIYEDLGNNIRQKKQPYTEFCEKKFAPNAQQAICEFRKSGTTKNDAYKNVLDCIFKGFRYFDKNGKIDMDGQVEEAISNCQLRGTTNAYDFYECLRTNDRLGNKFRLAFLYREVRSADYDYAFQIPGPPVYDANSVRQMVDLINENQCPKR